MCQNFYMYLCLRIFKRGIHFAVFPKVIWSQKLLFAQPLSGLVFSPEYSLRNFLASTYHGHTFCYPQMSWYTYTLLFTKLTQSKHHHHCFLPWSPNKKNITCTYRGWSLISEKSPLNILTFGGYYIFWNLSAFAIWTINNCSLI